MSEHINRAFLSLFDTGHNPATAILWQDPQKSNIGEKVSTRLLRGFSPIIFALITVLSGGCKAPSAEEIEELAAIQASAVTPEAAPDNTATPTIAIPTSTPQPADGETVTSGTEGVGVKSITTERELLPYFLVLGAPPNLSLLSSDSRLANNGPDEAGNDHKNPFMPRGASLLVAADPGHYRVDSLANVADPTVRASIERDIRNGAAFEGDDYKDVLIGSESFPPLWEAGGGAIFTGAQMQIEFIDANNNPVVFQLGHQQNHNWVAAIANGLNRDQIRGTDANRQLHLTHYDPGFTMWQAIPPGLFISSQYVCQTIADAHGSYRDRGTSPGQGQDGVTNVSILLAKILPEGVAFTVLKHNNPNTQWNQYKPDQFSVFNGNVTIK